MSHRLDQVRELLAETDADAVWLSAIRNVRWACGFTGSNAVLIVRPDDADFLTDGRYDTQAHREVDGATVHVVRGRFAKYAADESLLTPGDRVVFQSDHTTVRQRERLDEHLDAVTWIPVHQFLSRRVASKDASEVERIRQAQRITESVFEDVIGWIEPGRTEREVAAEIVYRHRRAGADEMAFEPIVASGPNAGLPHARPTDRTLQDGDVIVLDMGCYADGYASDMTRTIALGDPGDEVRQAYAVVREALEAALDAARSGMTTNDLDAVAREIIEAHGLGDAFSHSLGHGVGLDVHEWPRVSYATEDELPDGVCITIEPGVYLPDAGYGIRIEDIARVHGEGAENLTHVSHDLVTLPA